MQMKMFEDISQFNENIDVYYHAFGGVQTPAHKPVIIIHYYAPLYAVKEEIC